MKTILCLGILVALGSIMVKLISQGDLLTGFSSDMKVPDWQLQLAFLGFCASPLVTKVSAMTGGGHHSEDSEFNFTEHGHIDEGEYEKQSIYALLYSGYANLGSKLKESSNKPEYEFTFNTWGVAPSDVGDEDPQRYGKTSYAYFSKAPEIQKYVQSMNGEVQIVEIGCGTGAGAHYLSTKVFPKSKYMAIDMQSAAINTCDRLHASDRLTCVHIPEGVGNQNASIALADSSVDIVVILETHIAETRIGLEEKAIFAEISRILKPNGFFVWGNALPTRVWHEVEQYLPANRYQITKRWNNTQGAIIARNEDAARVKEVMQSIKDHFYAFSTPHIGEPCWEVVDKLIRNFYRDPGTALYEKMVKGIDSYMHYVFQFTK